MLRQELKIGVMEKECFLACFPFHVWLHFLHSQAHRAQGWNYAELGLPTWIGNQENVTQTCPQANLMIAALQVKSPLPKCVKLTTKVSHYFFIVFPFFHFCWKYILFSYHIFWLLFPPSTPPSSSPTPLLSGSTRLCLSIEKNKLLKSNEQTWQNIM